ncbi:MAG: outer membrane beta-barrel protein [Bacteroidales bacterium]|nr:outer membrane beta-barrel protein [Bacteroidales bacterium]
MKKTIIAILVFCTALLTFPTAPAQAQNSEVGACVGTTFYLGDLNPKKLFAQPHVAAGLVYRYNISPRWAIKADFMFGKVSASDSLTNNGYARNLSFSSPITEFSVVGELNFFQLYTSTGKNHFAPYIFAGVTVFSFNPMTEYNNETYELQSLGTEGQGLNDMPKKYSLTHFALPFGIGFRFNIGRYVSLGAEWSFRYTFTDYLDDVGGTYYDNELLREQRGDIIANLADRSPELTDPDGNPLPLHQAGEQRGNPTTHDLYSFAGATLTVKFGNSDRTCELKKKRKKY